MSDTTNNTKSELLENIADSTKKEFVPRAYMCNDTDLSIEFRDVSVDEEEYCVMNGDLTLCVVTLLIDRHPPAGLDELVGIRFINVSDSFKDMAYQYQQGNRLQVAQFLKTFEAMVVCGLLQQQHPRLWAMFVRTKDACSLIDMPFEVPRL